MSESKDSQMVAAIVCVVFIVTGLTFLLGMSLGQERGRYKSRIEAVEQGHAHWNVAPNGSTTFEWHPKQ